MFTFPHERVGAQRRTRTAETGRAEPADRHFLRSPDGTHLIDVSLHRNRCILQVKKRCWQRRAARPVLAFEGVISNVHCAIVQFSDPVTVTGTSETQIYGCLGVGRTAVLRPRRSSEIQPAEF
jgi:hypothetical protein